LPVEQEPDAGSPKGERGRHEINIISGTVSDVVFQLDRFEVTLDNGIYVYLQGAPKTGEKIEVRVRVECLE
jgi:hypothetical protein